MNRSLPSIRTVPFGRGPNEGKFTNNQIFTTKYSYLSFIPHAIILQFLYPRNFIFLANAILQSIRAISNLSPWTAILPLIVVIFISVLREGWQDYKRRRRDWGINLKQAWILRNGTFVTDIWQNIQVGDYVAVLKDHQMPADMILLQTSSDDGTAYVETANLDGEKNCKIKTSIFQNNKLYPAQLQQLQGVAEVDTPNTNLRSFNGRVMVDRKYSVPLSPENLMMRGTSLKNIDEVIGLVVYTGMDTKIMMNLGNVRNKVNRYETMINWIQLILAIFLFFMVLVCGLVYWRFWRYSDGSRGIFYLFRVHHYGVHGEAALASLSSFILLNTIIPLSLNISLDLIAAFQSDVYQYDIRMSHLIDDKRVYCTVNNSRTIPDLGIVSFILTDKTGTLTSNELQFKGIYIDRQTYTPTQLLSNRMNRSGSFSNFWLMVLVCNDIIIDKKTGEYQGSSTDQICLVNFATQIGYRFLRREKNHIVVETHGQQQTIEILQIIPFDERKMMSVIMRDPRSRQCVLCIKGADNKIMERVGGGVEKNSYKESIDGFSKQGLRTLVYATRGLNESEISVFTQEVATLKERRFRGEMSYEEYTMRYGESVRRIENGLSLVGTTAIEDKLQEGVSESIRDLRQAGIQIAMITGDKLETAESIGYLSNFIDRQSNVMRIREIDSVPEVEIHQLQQRMRATSSSRSQQSLIIEGNAIAGYINNANPEIQQMFANVLERCSSVIFSRTTPYQKGYIAMFYKRYYQGVVVAIGDGGNDVRMIQEADIGIGLVGREGNQASSAADFSLSRFRFISRLILHHGRWITFRMAFFFNYYGFKVTLVTIILFCYLAYAGYSGTSLLPNAFLAAYNSVLTVVLPIGYAVYQHDISCDTYQPVNNYLPLMYRDSKKLQLFSYWRFTLWTLAAIIYAVWIYFTTFYVLDSHIATDNHGRIPDQMSIAMNIEMSLYIFVSAIMIIEIRGYNLWMWFLVLFMTFVIGIIFFLIQNYAYVDDAYQALTNNFNLRFWLLILLNSSLGIAIRYVMITLNFTFWPSSIELAILQRNYLPEPMVNSYGHQYNELEFKSHSLPSSTSLI